MHDKIMHEEDDPNPIDEGVCRLQDPINMETLLNNRPTEFSIKDTEFMSPDQAYEEDTQLHDVYKFEEYQPYLYVDSDSGVEDEDGEGDGDGGEDADYVPFQSLRKKMFPVRDDGKVMKRIIREGAGERIPECDGSLWIIYVHYSAHVEFGETPFDCTYLRHKRPLRQRLGPGSGLLPGYDIAIRSMKKGEKARFLVHPELGYKSQGAPPRIPPDATLHFEIELFDFMPEKESETEAIETPQPETCQDRIQKAIRCRIRGNKCKRQEKNVNGAISQYRKGLGLLLSYRMANEEEEAEMRKVLISLYENLAVCYNEKEEYKRVCITYNDAAHDCNAKVNESAKLNYLSAKALRYLCNYDEAKKRLKRAARLNTGNQQILNEMAALEAAIDKAKRDERNRARRMMGFFTTPDAEDDDPLVLTSVTDEWKNLFSEILVEFLENPEEQTKRVDLEFTHAELKYCEHLCRSNNVGIRTTNDRIILTKRAL